MEYLHCGVQKYHWGKLGNESIVAKLVNEQNNDKERYAEIWIGVHPKSPSVLLSNPKILLHDFLIQNSSKYLHKKHQDFFKEVTIPFLLKVFSVDMPLSIQAHPGKALAEQLRKKDPEHYLDLNHKPELLVVLTKFEALACFKTVKEILTSIENSPHLSKLVGNEAIEKLKGVKDIVVKKEESTPEIIKSALKFTMDKLYSNGANPEVLTPLITAQKELINSKIANKTSEKGDELFLRIDKIYPNDIGLWMVYFLNYIQLEPGDGLFLQPQEPHAYLLGEAVEISANSDNCVRAGLTPKFKDVPVLIEMLTYETNTLEKSRFYYKKGPIQEYRPPAWCSDFCLYAIRLNKEDKMCDIDLPSVGLGVCVSGACSIKANNDEKKEVKAGSTFVLPFGKVHFEIIGKEDCYLFLGVTNIH